MSDQTLGVELASAQNAEQHRRVHRVYQPCGDGNVTIPQPLEVKRHLRSMRTQTLVLGEWESVCSILTTTSNYSGIVEGHSSEATVTSLILVGSGCRCVRN